MSEGGGIGTIVYEGIAATQKEAGEIALAAGLDVGISYESGYMQDLLASVREGKVPMSLIDRSVSRILKQKFRLGLFEKSLVDPERAVQIVHQPAHQDLSLQAAREAIVLLKNEKDLLPLKKTLRSIAVIGPNADSRTSGLGDYAPKRILQHVVSVLEGIKEAVSPDTTVTYVQGCDATGTEPNEIAKAKEAAAKAEAAIVVVGERQGGGRPSTDGEGQRLGHARIDRPSRGTGQGGAIDRHAHGGRVDQRSGAGRALGRPKRACGCRGLAARRKGRNGGGRGAVRRHEPQREALGDDSPPRRPTAGLLQLQKIETLLAAGERTQLRGYGRASRCIRSVTG